MRGGEGEREVEKGGRDRTSDTKSITILILSIIFCLTVFDSHDNNECGSMFLSTHHFSKYYC